MTVTLLALVEDVAYRLDDLKVYPVESATATTVRAHGLGNLTPSASANSYDGAWAYGSDQQSRVRTGGYAAAVSELTLTTPWTTPPAALSSLLITRLFPVGTADAPGEDTAYQRLVLDALRHLVYPDVLTLSITSADSYSLAAYSHWLDRASRLVGIREPAPVVGRRPAPASWRGPLVEREAGGVSLRLAAPFAPGASGALVLDVLRPPWTLVDGAESVDGPYLDAHTVEANPEDVTCVALALAYRALGIRQASSPDGADWMAKYEDQRQQAEALAAFDRTLRLPAAPTAPSAPREAA